MNPQNIGWGMKLLFKLKTIKIEINFYNMQRSKSNTNQTKYIENPNEKYQRANKWFELINPNYLSCKGRCN